MSFIKFVVFNKTYLQGSFQTQPKQMLFRKYLVWKIYSSSSSLCLILMNLERGILRYGAKGRLRKRVCVRTKDFANLISWD